MTDFVSVENCSQTLAVRLIRSVREEGAGEE